MKSGPARVPLLAPSMRRVYGLRTATVFLVMIVALGAGTFMLREAATAQVIGARKGYAGDNGPAIEAWLDTPGGIVVAPTGDVFFADSNNHVIRRIDPREQHQHRSSATTRPAPASRATSARRRRRSSTRRTASASRRTAI